MDIILSGYGWTAVNRGLQSTKPINLIDNFIINLESPNGQQVKLLIDKDFLSKYSGYFEGLFSDPLFDVDQLTISINNPNILTRLYDGLITGLLHFTDLDDLYDLLYEAVFFDIRVIYMNIIKLISDLEFAADEFAYIYSKIRNGLSEGFRTILLIEMMKNPDMFKLMTLPLDDFLYVIEDDRLMMPELIINHSTFNQMVVSIKYFGVADMAVRYIRHHRLYVKDIKEVLDRVRFPIILLEPGSIPYDQYPEFGPYLASTMSLQNRLTTLSMPPLKYNVNRPRKYVQRLLTISSALSGSTPKRDDIVVYIRSVDDDTITVSGYPPFHRFKYDNNFLTKSFQGLKSGDIQITAGMIVEISHFRTFYGIINHENINVIYPKVDLSELIP